MFFLLLWSASIIATVFIARRKNLSVVGFIILALFLGPLAVLIVSLLSPVQDSVPLNKGGSMQEEFAGIKRSFALLEQRINALEARIGIPAPQALSGQPELKTPQKTAVVSGEGQGVYAKESLEFTFGKYWLNRIGVAAVFLGIVFFISYTFTYLNALSKIGIGYFIAMGFLAWGNYLEKKERYVRLSWGILGGAWGILYLSTFAMYYIRETRIINNPVLELFLLAVVSFFAVTYNLRYRSWIVTSLTFLFAFITAGLGGIEYSTIIYCAFLTAGIVFLACQLRWYKFFLIGVAGLYLIYAYWLWPNIFMAELVSESLTVPIIQFILIFGILSITYAFFTLGIFFIKETVDGSLRYTVAALLLNTGFYVSLALNALYRLRRTLDVSWDIRFWFLVLVAVLSLCYAALFGLRARSKAIVCNVSSALVLATMAMVVHFGARNAVFFWLCAAAVFFLLGVYYKEFVYRLISGVASVFVFIRLLGFDYFSSGVHSIFGVEIAHVVLAFGCWSLYFFIVGALEKSLYIQQLLRKEERAIHYSLIVLGTALLGFLLFKEVSPRWLTLAFVSLAVTVLSTGFLLDHIIFRVCGLSVISISCIRLIFVDMVNVHTLYRITTFILLGAALLAASMIYSKFMEKNRQS